MASCSGADSFGIAGFQLSAYNGCYTASSVSTFNFLPVFYNTADGMPADGPTVYASDLFGTLADEYVFAIGSYDQSRDVVGRYCSDAAGTSAATTHPAEVAAWDCGDLTTAFTVTCGCSTPAPLVAATPSPSVAPSLAAVTPGPSDAVTPAPTALAIVRVADTPSPTAVGSLVKPTSAPVVSDTPSPTAAGTTVKPTSAPPVVSTTPVPTVAGTTVKPASAAPVVSTTTPVPTDAPVAASREISIPSPAPTAAQNSSSTSSPGAACSETGPFRLGGFQIESYNGCYSASAVSTFNFLPVFYIDGALADGPAVYASDMFGSLTGEYVWSIGNFDQGRDVVDTRHCVDADGSDASTIHPSEVATWTCEDSSVVDSAAAFTVACGCSTPAPSPAAPITPTPASCVGGDPFRVSDIVHPALNGCYSASGSSTFNFNSVFFAGGEVADGPAVYASDLFGSLVDEYVWSIGNYRQSSDDIDTRYCYDNDRANASTIHPSDVTSWDCGSLNSTALSVTCGCATPAPATTSPAATPSPDGARGIDIASSSAPVAAAEIAEETPARDTQGVPLVVAIITAVVVFVVIMIGLSIVFESLRKGLWMCLTCKRESKSNETALVHSELSSRGALEPPTAASGGSTSQ